MRRRMIAGMSLLLVAGIPGQMALGAGPRDAPDTKTARTSRSSVRSDRDDRTERNRTAVPEPIIEYGIEALAVPYALEVLYDSEPDIYDQLLTLITGTEADDLSLGDNVGIRTARSDLLDGSSEFLYAWTTAESELFTVLDTWNALRLFALAQDDEGMYDVVVDAPVLDEGTEVISVDDRPSAQFAPTTGNGDYVATAVTINSIKTVGDATILIQTVTLEYTGFQEGTYVGREAGVIHGSIGFGDFSFVGRGTFTGTIGGISVTAKQTYQGVGSGIDYEGTYSIADGRAGVNGQGTYTGAGLGVGGSGPYSGQYHFRP